MSIIPTPNLDYTNKDYEAFRNFMLEQLGIYMPEYTDHSQTDAGIVILELLAKGLDILSFNQDVQANEAFLVTAEQRANALKWCSMLDYTPRSSTPSKIKQVFVLSSAQNSITYIPAGTRIKTVETQAEPSVMFETLEDLEIPAGKLGNETDDEGNYLYSVTAVQGYTVDNEYVGSSNGTEDQRFTLGYTPVISSSITVLVNEGGGYEKWERVDNFLDSDNSSKHYKVELTDNSEAVIVFGNGITGKIPADFSNGIVATYRIGGGTQGNVGANKVTVLDTNIALVAETFNPDSYFEEGFDKETLSEIKVNAPNSFRIRWSCLEEQDYADRVKELFPQVIFASSCKSPTEVDIMNVYLFLGEDKELTDDLRVEIEEMFEARALVGTEVTLIPASEDTFIPLTLNVSLILQDRYSQSSARTQIDSMFTDFFAKGNYDYHTECSVTELEAMIKEDVPGLRSVRISITSDISSEGDLVVSPDIDQILTLGSINYNITGGIAD